jgi:hypothetical protein
MNERIQILAGQAEDYADGIVDQGGEFHEAYTQKLAELIIKECADVATVNQYQAFTPGYYVKKHFGVFRS